MPQAQIQFSQGAVTPAAGQSALGFVAHSTVTLFDAAGAGATSWAWTIVGFPGPLGSAPVITNSSQQTATVTPPLDGVYLVRLVRVDGAITTVDLRFFGVADAAYGFYLPTAGMTGNMSNIGGSAAAQASGWEGRSDASTNVFLDALLRFLRDRVGRFAGLVQSTGFSAGVPTSTTLMDGVDRPLQVLSLTGAGLYTAQLDKPTASEGKTFECKVSLTAGSGGFALLNGVSGTSILALTAPVTGTVSWMVRAIFDGVDWFVGSLCLLDPKAHPTQVEIPIVAGFQTTQQTTAVRIGSLRLDLSKYPSNTTVTFQATIEATAGHTASILLYNVTDGGAVVGSTLTSTALTPTVVSATVSLPNTQKDYEVHLYMDAGGINTDHVDCTAAKLLLSWG